MVLVNDRGNIYLFIPIVSSFNFIDMKYLCILFVFVFFNCKDRQDQKRISESLVNIPITDFDTAYGKLSEFTDEIQMIPLETNDLSLLTDVEKLVMTKDFIFIIEKKNVEGIFMFDRKGHFIRKIGSRGEGPDEFISCRDFSLDEKEEILYLYDIPRKRILSFSFKNEFLKEFKMNYYATRFEYYNGLFYLYTENPDFGNPLSSLVIKDKNGNIINSYYPAKKMQYSKISTVFQKTPMGLYFFQNMVDSIFVLKQKQLDPLYFVDYKSKVMKMEDREDIRNQVRLPINILLEKKTIAGIEKIMEINNKVFIQNLNIIVPFFTVYDKNTKITKTFNFILNDFNFISLSMPIAQYEDYLIFLESHKSIIRSLDTGFKTWIKEGFIDSKKAFELKNEITNKIQLLDEDENPVIFLFKVKK